MNKMKKFALIAVCAMLLVCVTIGATVAYLSSKTEQVTNTFTVGKVKITLDEADVNTAGELLNKDGGVYGQGDELAARVIENDYHLLPGHYYVKDPTVHVEANSEDCWVFVKVDNQIADLEAVKTIATQIAENGWTALTEEPGVYYRKVTKSTNVQDLVVFDHFQVKGDLTNETLEAYEGKTVTVIAYAIQQGGFDTTASAVWAQVKNI